MIKQQHEILFAIEETKFLEKHNARKYFRDRFDKYKYCMQVWKNQREKTLRVLIPPRFMNEIELQRLLDTWEFQINQAIEEIKSEIELEVVDTKLNNLKTIMRKEFDLFWRCF